MLQKTLTLSLFWQIWDTESAGWADKGQGGGGWAWVAGEWRVLPTSNLAFLMKGCQGFTISQSGFPPTPQPPPHPPFDTRCKVVFVCMCVSKWERNRESLVGDRKPEKEEKRGEDFFWNCPSVALVVLSHFISATAAFFLPSICPVTILTPLSEQEKHSLSHHGWLNTITELFFPPPILLSLSLHSTTLFV